MRTYKRKTEQISVSSEDLVSAAEVVRETDRSVRNVAAEFRMNFMKLYRFCRAGASSAVPPVIRQQHNRQIFSRVQENELVEYLETAAKLYHGLAPKEFYVGTAVSNVYSITNLGVELKAQLIKTSHYEAINGLAFPFACSEIIATCSKQDIRLWYLLTRQEVVRITVPNHTCNAIAIMKDGKTIVSGWSDCRIRAFYPESGKPMYVVNSAFGAMVTAIATYSSCQKIVSGSDLGHVVVWDVPQWRVHNDLNYASKHFLLKEHKATVTCIKMLKDDTECVTSSIDGSCVIWDLVHRHRRHMLRVNTLFMFVCYHPAEHQVLTTGTDRKIAFWETYDASMIRELDGSLSGSVNAMDINADGTYLVTGGDDKMIKLWRYEEGEVTHIGRGHSAPITVICISPDESCIISVSADGAILCWTFPGHKVPEEPEPEPESTKPGSHELAPVGSPSKLSTD